LRHSAMSAVPQVTGFLPVRHIAPSAEQGPRRQPCGCNRLSPTLRLSSPPRGARSISRP
jgi:hypothetical protein